MSAELSHVYHYFSSGFSLQEKFYGIIYLQMKRGENNQRQKITTCKMDSLIFIWTLCSGDASNFQDFKYMYGYLWWQTSYCTRRSKNNKKCCTKALFLFRKLEMHAVAIIIQGGDNWSRSHLTNKPQEIVFKKEVHSFLYNSVSASYGNTKSDCNLASH